MIDIDPREIRAAVARAWPKRSHGSNKIPRNVALGMYEDYQVNGSLRKTAANFGRDASTIWFIFKANGLKLKRRGGPNHARDRKTVIGWYVVYCDLHSIKDAAAKIGVAPITLSRAFKSFGWPVLSRWQVCRQEKRGGYCRRAA